MKKPFLSIPQCLAILLAAILLIGTIAITAYRQHRQAIAVKNAAELGDITNISPKIKAEAISRSEQTIQDEKERLDRINRQLNEITNRDNLTN